MKIAIASGKGGTGKTFVSTNLFYSLQEAGMTVSLVDCDAEEPNVAEFVKGDGVTLKTIKQHVPVIDVNQCVFCGKCQEYCNYHAIVFLQHSRFIQVVEDLCHDCGACLVACEYGAISEKEIEIGEISSFHVYNHSEIIEGRAHVGQFSPVPIIKNAIRELNGDAVAILDSPPGISCPFIATVDKADFTVLVTEPTPFGLNDLKLSVATLKHLGKPFGVIINRAGIGNRDVHKWLEVNSIPLLLEIPFDKEIARIYSEGLLLAESSPAYRILFAALFNSIDNLVKDRCFNP